MPIAENLEVTVVGGHHILSFSSRAPNGARHCLSKEVNRVIVLTYSVQETTPSCLVNSVSQI